MYAANSITSHESSEGLCSTTIPPTQCLLRYSQPMKILKAESYYNNIMNTCGNWQEMSSGSGELTAASHFSYVVQLQLSLEF